MSATRAACCMLCVTTTIVYLFFSVVHQVLDPRGRDRVERGGRLVHQQHLGLDGERAGDAEPLLLAAREAERALLEAVADVVPQRRLLEGVLDAVVKVVLHPEHAQAPGDVVVDRLGERVRLLEDHPDPPPHLHRIDLGRVQVDAVVEHLSLDLGAWNQVVHPVQRADERALSAARRPDDGAVTMFR